MNFQPSSDHLALLDAVQALVSREAAARPVNPVRYEYLPQLRDVIAGAGFFGCMEIDELGALAAADVVMALAHLPFCVEALASGLIAPLACPGEAGPFALAGESLTDPIRYLPVAQVLIRIRDTGAEAATLRPGAAAAAPGIFGYPMGVLADPASLQWSPVRGTDAASLARLWRVGLACEIAGCLAAGLQSVIRHVRDRRQFGRPLGSFQAVQHRLAQAACKIEGVRWLALRAAGTGLAADASLAAGQAQDIATRVSYDLHQFMGAMGLTLEHPLHRWTYRVKLLRSELGGAAGQFVRLADEAWPEDAAERAGGSAGEGMAGTSTRQALEGAA